MKLIKQHRAHFSSITCVSFTFNDEYLISGSLDGTIVCWNAKGLQIPDKMLSEQNEDILINKFEYTEKFDDIKRGYERLNEANLNISLAYKIKELKFNEKIRALITKFNNEILTLNEQVKQQKDLEKSCNDERNEKMKTLIKDYVIKIENEKNVLSDKNRFESEKVKSLEWEIDGLKFEIDQQVETMNTQKTKNILIKKKEKELLLESILKKHDNEVKEKIESIKNLEEYRKNYLTEIENEQTELKKAFKKQICDLKICNKSLKMESTLLKRQIDLQVSYTDEYKALFKNKETEIADLTKKIVEQEQFEETLRKQIAKNDKQALDCETRINDLFQITIDLEKYDCVHKFTIEELNKQVEEIRNVNHELNNTSSEKVKEFKQYEHELVHLRNFMGSQRLKLLVVQNDTETIMRKIEVLHEERNLIFLVIKFISEKFLKKTNNQPQLLIWFEKKFLNKNNSCLRRIDEEAKTLTQAINLMNANFVEQIIKNNKKRKKMNSEFYNTKNLIKCINRKRTFLEHRVQHQIKFHKNKKKVLASNIIALNRNKTQNEKEILFEEKRIRYLENAIEVLNFAIKYMESNNIASIDELTKNILESSIRNQESIEDTINSTLMDSNESYRSTTTDKSKN